MIFEIELCSSVREHTNFIYIKLVLTVVTRHRETLSSEGKMDKKNDKTISERFRNVIGKFQTIFNGNSGFNDRKDSVNYQSNVRDMIKEFSLIQTIADRLSLFSANESIDEINVNYIQFINLDYYLGCLFSEYLLNPKTGEIPEPSNAIEFKEINISIARAKFLSYIAQLDNYSKILSKSQSSRLNSFKDTYNPTYDELLTYTNPAQKRADKIENYKLEKELKGKLQILDDFYSQNEEREEHEDSILEKFDEEIVKAIYIDQLRLHSIKAFNNLELLTMELQVLSNRPKQPITALKPPQQKEKPTIENDYGYTARLESLPFLNKTNVSDLISKQGKILRPFTITSNKNDLRLKVFGTGQVLPSMSVEEYLDYELANGKMMKEEVKDTGNDSDTDNSDEEIEKREWDDWKDDNPKGSGNMKANIG